MERYGEIQSSFKVKKRIIGKVIEIGTRVVQFKSLKGPIPKIIRFANRSIRVKHTGQKVVEEKKNYEQAEKNEQQTEQNKQQAEQKK